MIVRWKLLCQCDHGGSTFDLLFYVGCSAEVTKNVISEYIYNTTIVSNRAIKKLFRESPIMFYGEAYTKLNAVLFIRAHRETIDRLVRRVAARRFIVSRKKNRLCLF